LPLSLASVYVKCPDSSPPAVNQTSTCWPGVAPVAAVARMWW
jgi:hypothetical protein